MTKKHLENDLKKVSESHFGYIINIMRKREFQYTFLWPKYCDATAGTSEYIAACEHS